MKVMVKKFKEYLNDNFWLWFGDSRVIDDQGKPLIVYHGTSSDFKSFDSNKSAMGGIFWFSSDKKKIEDGESGAAGRSIILPVYLSIQNMAGWSEYQKLGLGQIRERGFDGIKLDDDYIVFNSNQIKSATNNNGKFNPKRKSIFENNLFEYRHQLEIPFGGKHPLHDKPTHVHVVDALKDMDKKNNANVDKYNSNWTTNDIKISWENNIEDAFQRYNAYMDSDNTDVNYHFLGQYSPIGDSEYFNDVISGYIEENENDDEQDIINEFGLYEDLRNYLSEEGMSILDNEITRSLFDEKVDEYNVLYSLNQNLTDDGLIPLYRAISYSKNLDHDVYTNIMKYDNVGIFWSFEYSGAEPHGGGAGHTLILCAYIKPEYINWISTIYKSAWNLNDEREIELEEDVDILIYNIVDYKTGKSINLEKSLIVKT